MVHAFNIRHTSMHSRPAWSTKRILHQLELHSEDLFQKIQMKEKKRKESLMRNHNTIS